MIRVKDIVNKKVYDEDIVQAIYNITGITEEDISNVIAIVINGYYPIMNRDCVHIIDSSQMCDIIAEAQEYKYKRYFVVMDKDGEITIIPF